MDDENKTVDEKIVDTTFKSIIDTFSEHPDFQNKLSSTNALIIPSSIFDNQDTYFPQGTIDFYQYLHSNSPPELNIDIAVLDEKYAEFPKYNETIEIATIIVKYVCLPIVLPIISRYIYDKYLSKNNEEKHEIKSEILITKNDTTVAYKYCGPAKTYEKLMLDYLKNVNEITEGSEEN
ncbi:MAG: hypothetical protein RBQ97_10105 [Acholeplasma sp.]|nr:hypothetical protein [Acholeplasma sp.]